MKKINKPPKPGLYGFRPVGQIYIEFIIVCRLSAYTYPLLLKKKTLGSGYFYNITDEGDWYRPSWWDRFRLGAARRLGLIEWKHTSWIYKLQCVFGKILGF